MFGALRFCKEGQMISLTKAGSKKVKHYIKNLKAKRKEILDAGKDTADETRIPDEHDILLDILFFEENDEYLNGWGVTDNYDSDFPLDLKRGEDYIERI